VQRVREEVEERSQSVLFGLLVCKKVLQERSSNRQEMEGLLEYSEEGVKESVTAR